MDPKTYPSRKDAQAAIAAMAGRECPRATLLYLPDDRFRSRRGNSWVVAVGPTGSRKYLRLDGFAR
jgi:hypothetical protein